MFVHSKRVPRSAGRLFFGVHSPSMAHTTIHQIMRSTTMSAVYFKYKQCVLLMFLIVQLSNSGCIISNVTYHDCCNVQRKRNNRAERANAAQKPNAILVELLSNFLLTGDVIYVKGGHQ